MQKQRKWLIENEGKLTDIQRESYWKNTHLNENYETVWSMTDDHKVREKLIREIEIFENSKILIPGCGSRVTLQNQIAMMVDEVEEILCTDFADVIDKAKLNDNHIKIKYDVRNSQKLGFRDEWDIIIVVNSILSENDEENRNILESCFESLKPGGFLVGMFPTIFATLDMGYLEENSEFLNRVDAVKSSYREDKQGLWQIFYTPLRLRRIMLESGFDLKKMEIFFCDSEYFIEHSREYYGIQDPDMVIYELFISAQKPLIEV
ncbi:class I SAM-dependent methyltransferase [Sessilibacter sp. MAH4]